jgi:hypothetical protein
MQALTVLILEVTYGKSSQDDDLTAAEESITKLLRWLKCMRAKNAVAKRAYNLISSILLDADPPAPASIREFLLDNKPDGRANTTLQVPQSFPQYGHGTSWSSALGPETLPSVQGQDYLDYTLSAQPFPGLGTATSGESMFVEDMPYGAPGGENLTSTEFPFPLQPVAVLDFLADPWNSEEAD